MREAYTVTLDTSYLGSGDMAKATMGLREINLAGKARDNEIKFSELSPKDKISMLEAMKREWQKWTEFKATKYVSEHDFAEMRKQQPSLRVVGTRWVLTRKTPSGAFKARLVVQGCQEDRNAMRTDAPTGSRDALFLTLAAAAQKGFSLVSYDAESAYLQAEGINRLLLLRLPLVNPPPGCRPGQIVRAAGSIYGTRDAGRAWYKYAKQEIEKEGFIESKLERGLYFLPGANGPRCVLHTHVDDILAARDDSDQELSEKLVRLEKKLLLKKQASSFHYCGRLIEDTPDRITVTRTMAAESIEPIALSMARLAQRDSPVTDEGRSSYRSVLGQLHWLSGQTRPDLAAEVSLLAQEVTRATVNDFAEINGCVRRAKSLKHVGIVLKRNTIKLKGSVVVAFGDAAFANAEGAKIAVGRHHGPHPLPAEGLAGRLPPRAHHLLALIDSEARREVNPRCRGLRDVRSPRNPALRKLQVIR